jgi:hypothetical protein
MKKKRMVPETELYEPVKKYLEALGYTVRGEVADCDIAALHGDELIAVELKSSINLKLILQATERQESCDAVYLAVPAEGSSYPADFKAKLRLVKRLELGLLLVRFLSHRIRVELVCHPAGSGPRKSRRKRQVILREFSGRSGDYTPGGTRGKVITAYREQALYIACLLHREGPLSPARCRKLGAPDKAAAILQANHYGWFERVSRGLYRLHEAGRQALKEYPELVKAMEIPDPD